jgi:hypothetical protein
MNRPRAAFHRFSFVPVLLLPLLPLVACGGGPDQGEQVQESETPAPPAPGQPEEDGRRGPKGHIKLTGTLQFDGETPLECETGAQGLNLFYNRNSGEASQVQLQVPTFTAAGKYQATAILREGGSGRTWNGTAEIEIQSRDMNRKANNKRTALSGTFNGSYKGDGGEGTLSGDFRRCVLREPA